MKFFRWVFLVCGLLSVVLVVPVRSDGGNLVVNGDFSTYDLYSPDVIPAWPPDEGSGSPIQCKDQCVLQHLPVFHDAEPSLAQAMSSPSQISLSQCVDTFSLNSVDVGGWLRLNVWSLGCIKVTVYRAPGCDEADLAADFGGTMMATEDNSGSLIWTALSQQYSLPGSPDGTSVKITLKTMNNAGLHEVHFDDIFLRKSVGTSVLLVQPSGRASTSVVVAAALAGIGAAIAFLRRH